MYKAFYNLSRSPFEITPDPTFLFPTRKHNEALAALYYGIRQRKGFVVLTGEVGTGKTLLVRCLLDYIKKNNITYAYVFDPCLSPLEFLQFIAEDLRLTSSGKTKGELLHSLGAYLIERNKTQHTTVLIVDEAHLLMPDVLEEIRLLTNLETSQEKLLQIVLAGQPELDQKLDSFALRQLKQRIALRSQLDPLDEQETSGYVQRRLRLAGATSHTQTLFPPETLAKVYISSGGIPRVINTLCENALITAYAGKADHVAPEMVESAAADLRLNVLSFPTHSSINKRRKGTSDLERAVGFLLDLDQRGKQVDSAQEAITIGESNHEPVI
jgi:general secretion pathway protein A